MNMGNDFISAASLKPSELPKKGSWVKNLLNLLGAFAIFLAVKSSLIEPFKIPSGSMIPTLMVGDHILVNKLAYELKVPFTDWFQNGKTLIKWASPARGDIIVFRFPRNPALFYIKRVLGLPGDKIEIKNKSVFINGTILEQSVESPTVTEEILKTLNDSTRYNEKTTQVINEILPSQKAHWILVDQNNFMGSNAPSTLIPPGTYFVMGDNRDSSNDSRFWGFVPQENIAGKAVLIWMSFWPDLENKTLTMHPERAGTFLK